MGYAVRRYPLLACFLYLGLAAARILPGNAHGAESGRPKIRLALSGDTLDDNAPIQNLFRTGGFRSLSGFNQNQLSVQHEGLVLLSSLSSLAEVTRVSGPLGCSPGGC